MTEHRTEFRDALTSGDPDTVNSAIETVENMDAEERAELFDDAIEIYVGLYYDGDSYQRLSIVRFVRELLPQQHILAIFKDEPDKDPPAHFIMDEMESHIGRLEAFYLAALDDADGQVQQAAIKGLNDLSVAYQMGGDNERLDDLLETLSGLLAETTEKKSERVKLAWDDVQQKREELGLPDLFGRSSDDGGTDR